MSDGGKGSAPRPFSVDQETFKANWERTFGGKVRIIPWSLEDSLDSPEAIAEYERQEAEDEQAP